MSQHSRNLLNIECFFRVSYESIVKYNYSKLLIKNNGIKYCTC